MFLLIQTCTFNIIPHIKVERRYATVSEKKAEKQTNVSNRQDKQL